MALRQIINTVKAPRPQAPYNQAVRVGDTVYVSGVLGMDKATNKIVEGDVEAETKQLMENLEAVLKAAGSGLDKLVKTTIMLNDISDFPIVNNIYKQYIGENFPARSCYQVGKLPLNGRVEIEAIGLCGEVKTVLLDQ